MAVQFLTRAVIQQITQRVLSGVVEQLPEKLAQRSGDAPKSSLEDLPRMNALALGELQAHVQGLEGQVQRQRNRMARLEQRTGWRAYARLAFTALLTYALGFATAIILRALDWIG